MNPNNTNEHSSERNYITNSREVKRENSLETNQNKEEAIYNQLGQIQQRLDGFTENFEQITGKISELTRLFLEFQNTVNGKEVEKKNAETQTEPFLMESIYERKMQELGSSLQEKDKRIEELTEQHEKDSLSRMVNREEIEKLTEHLNNLQEKKEELEKQLEESRNNEAELTEKIERLNQKIERSREKRRKIREEKDSEINELMKQVADLEQQLEQIKRNEQKVQQENEKLKEKINQTNQRLEQTKAKNSTKKSTSQDKFTYIKPIRNHIIYKCNTSLYRQSHYDISNGVATGGETPTTILVKANGKPKNWESILEIRYANDILHNEVKDPKVIFYRSDDNNCYIILRIDGNNHGVIYGLNERCVEIGKNSFSVYEVSGDVGSFTDDVSRLIYVDNSGLYIVSAEENPVEQVSTTYKEDGQFNFKGSIIKVSATDGSITLNNEEITKDNFFDNWVEEGSKIILSTKQPEQNEVLKNFYPSRGDYERIYLQYFTFKGFKARRGLNTFTEKQEFFKYAGYVKNRGRNWMNLFINKRLQLVNARKKSKAEELVRDGTFSSILSLYNDRGDISFNIPSTISGYSQKVRDAIATQVAASGKKTSYLDRRGTVVPYNIWDMAKNNSDLFKNPEFIKSLKPAFAELEKDYEHNKESEMWIPFEIVRNL